MKKTLTVLALATNLAGCIHNQPISYPLFMREHEERKLDGVIGSVNETMMYPPDSIVHYRVSIKIPTQPTDQSRGAMNQRIKSVKDTLVANMVFTNGDFPNGFPFSKEERVSLYITRGFPRIGPESFQLLNRQTGKIRRR